ncbi:hypothetical protein DPEC_G00341380 [Dallia pectoralis]|uniref:Uncharacterized protein n=1 Tax=Dallia pectoralis TaxID=75939 RepID=A0ACC2F5F8_DALPE|nr:hypothetical protein DPEC_G00341380 [Dallia pectoralis]
MDRQGDYEMNTKVIVPGHFRCLAASLCIIGLVNVFFFVGLCFNVGVHRDLDKLKKNCTEKVFQNFNKTYKITKGQIDNGREKFEIFTVPKDGLYFLYGRVRVHNAGTVHLMWERTNRSTTIHPLQIYHKSCHLENIFAGETEFYKNSRVFLTFDIAKPDLENSEFTLYRLPRVKIEHSDV